MFKAAISKQNYLHANIKMCMNYEEKYRPILETALSKHIELLAANKDGLKPLIDALEQLNKEVLTNFAKMFYSSQKSVIISETKSSLTVAMQSFIKEHALEAATIISNTSKLRIAPILEAGTGLSEEDLRDQIITAESGAIQAWRAALIARTEVHLAAVTGTHEAAVEVTKTDKVEYEKEWLSAIDYRTRTDHAEANGQKRDIDKLFNVGGELIDYPGKGSASNAINCRCVVMYHPKD